MAGGTHRVRSAEVLELIFKENADKRDMRENIEFRTKNTPAENVKSEIQMSFIRIRSNCYFLR